MAHSRLTPTITACILARNEEHRIEDALRSLAGWTDEIVVIDNESDDRTVQIARRYGAHVLTAPRAANFDAARNLAIERAKGDWIFYLDADERVPPRLGEALQQLVREHGDEFEALLIPFKHFFCGKWMEHSGWWPGYTRPQLLKKECFRYNTRLHSGVEVDGRTGRFPADDPDLAIIHLSYDSIPHYLTKLNRYTDGEAESLYADGALHSWQAQLAHFVHDWQVYYERGRADLDGMHGFVLAFLSAFYRYFSRAKLWLTRSRRGELIGPEPVPGSVREMLQFMARVAREGSETWLQPHQYPVDCGPGREVDRVLPDWFAPWPPETSPCPSAGLPSRARITACIIARNEEARIEGALRSLKGWTARIVVVDHASTDQTAEIARRYADVVLTALEGTSLEEVRRQMQAEIEAAAEADWLFFLDADERVSPALGAALRRLVEERGEKFDAIAVPFKNHYYGKWMQSGVWWPGYAGPRLLRRGAFQYNPVVHSGFQVDGRLLFFPADDPAYAIEHYAYADLHEYLTRLNRYTDAEAELRDASGQSHAWQSQLTHFVQDWQVHYDHGQASRDGMHGFVQSFLCAFYRFVTRAKIWDRRRQRGEVQPGEPVPGSLKEMLEFMERVVEQGPQACLPAPSQPASSRPAPLPTTASDPVAAEVPLLWHGPLLDASGYADEGRQFVLGLIEAGEPVATAPVTWNPEEAELPPTDRAALVERALPAGTPAELFVSHTLPNLQRPSPHARVNIARTMFETDSLPDGWAAILNRMDRVWVPSEFNRETFTQGGVDPAKIAVVPGAIDPAFALEGAPWPVPGTERYKFLTVFDWTLHKGWDVLLEAFAAEFGDDPSVGLIVKTWSSNRLTWDDIQAQADTFLRKQCGRSLADLPNLHLWHTQIPAPELPRLYRAVDAFVLPTRGEGWCRPLMEAMAAGLPTIATAWSGLTAFHNAEVGYPLSYELVPVSEAGAREIPIFRGHRWAEPSLGALRKLMRRLVTDPEAARAKGRQAQEAVLARYSRPVVAALLREEIACCRQLAAQKQPLSVHSAAPRPVPAAPEQQKPVPLAPKAHPLPLDPPPAVDLGAALGRPVRVRWEGCQSIRSSLALVNRELCLGLLERGDVELSVVETVTPWHTLTPVDDPRLAALHARRDAALSGPPDVTVRHFFPPNWRRPAGEGKLVVMQPWELSHLPRTEWLEGAIRHADEVWAYSRFVRDIYVRSGVPAEKVRLMPLGVRTDVFRPDGPEYPLPTEKTVRFLFVGGALQRKGADLLLAAYQRAFTRDDDVCLVVKDMGTRTFYQGQTCKEAFRGAESDPDGPEVLYLEDDLSDEQLAALYRSCTCVVLAYRGEGFGLAPLEGMACGKPAIVTAGGPTDDYLDDTMALRVPCRREVKPGVYHEPGGCPWDPWEMVPDLDALVDALRWVFDNPEQTRERGKSALAHVRAGWSWERSVATARERLAALIAPPVPAEPVPARLWAEPKREEKGRRKSRHGGREPERLELSLCMIVRDEAPRIGKCLKSIAPFVDEMIVVDTGSKDRTRQIARECGAFVFDFPWTDSFAEARNQSLAQARGQWIFWMDADDVISPRCGGELRKLIRRHPNRDAAFQAQVRIPPGPGEFSEAVVDHVKLFPNRDEIRFEHRIHEQVLPSIRQAGLEILFSDLYVTHQHYDRSAAGQAKKRQRDFQLLELDLQDRPEHPFVLFNLGMTYLYATHDYEVAAQYLRRSLNGSHWQASIVRKAYAMLGQARMAQGDWEAARAANEEGRRYYPDDAELLFQVGQIYGRLDRWDDARTALERLVEGRDDAHYRSVDTGLRTYRGWEELALLFRRLGDAPHCEQVLREIVTAHPSYLPAQLHLVDTLHGLGKVTEARRLLDRIPEVESLRVDLGQLRELVGAA